MKKLFLIVLCAIFPFILFSQNGNNSQCDKIVLIDGTEIDALISEYSSIEIKYKKCNNKDGPTYTLESNKVFIIKLTNGTKEVMTDLNHQTKTNSNSKLPKPEKEKTIPLFFGLDIIMAPSFNLREYSSFCHSVNFIGNYKFSNVFEFDLSIGLGLHNVNSNVYSNYKFLSRIGNPYVRSTSPAFSNNLGFRFNFLNLNKTIKTEKYCPFLKPEFNLNITSTNTFASISLYSGINVKKTKNKSFTLSIGYKYFGRKMFYYQQGYYDVNNVYHFGGMTNTSKKVNFNNLVLRFSMEF